MSLLVCLVGEQQLSNLLPIRHLSPRSVLLVHSERTRERASVLAKFLQAETAAELLFVDAYNLPAAASAMRAAVAKRPDPSAPLLFNLTGGTKLMTLAAFLVACELQAPAVYLQSEGAEARLHRLTCALSGVSSSSSETLDCHVPVTDFLRLHLGIYKPGPVYHRDSAVFEEAIAKVAAEVCDEVVPNVARGNLELDLVLRRGNRFAVAEISVAKSGLKAKLDQLVAATDSQNLGTYTGRLIVLADDLDPNNLELAKAQRVRVARARRTESGIDPDDVPALIDAILASLGSAAKKRSLTGE